VWQLAGGGRVGSCRGYFVGRHLWGLGDLITYGLQDKNVIPNAGHTGGEMHCVKLRSLARTGDTPSLAVSRDLVSMLTITYQDEAVSPSNKGYQCVHMYHVCTCLLYVRVP
jgi:hypothetical protein